MKKINFWLTILLGAQVVFFALVWAFCGRGEKIQAERQVLFEGVARDSIERILVEESEGKKIELRKKDGTWRLPDKNDYPADDKKIDRVLGQILGLESIYLLTSDPAYHYEYEVAAEKFRRRLTLEGGGKTRTLIIGKAGADNYTQVRVDGKPQVWAVDELKYWDLGTQVYDWAKKEVLDEDAKRIARLEIEKGGENFLLEREDLSSWNFEGQKAQKTNADELASKAAKIELADVAGLAKDEELKKKLEGAKEAVTVKVHLAADPLAEKPAEQPKSEQPAAEGKTAEEAKPSKPVINQVITLHLAKDPEKDSQVYLLKEGSDYIVKVDLWRVRPLLEVSRDKLVAK